MLEEALDAEMKTRAPCVYIIAFICLVLMGILIYKISSSITLKKEFDYVKAIVPDAISYFDDNRQFFDLLLSFGEDTKALNEYIRERMGKEYEVDRYSIEPIETGDSIVRYAIIVSMWTDEFYTDSIPESSIYDIFTKEDEVLINAQIRLIDSYDLTEMSGIHISDFEIRLTFTFRDDVYLDIVSPIFYSKSSDNIANIKNKRYAIPLSDEWEIVVWRLRHVW
jgi:hypothetical protein